MSNQIQKYQKYRVLSENPLSGRVTYLAEEVISKKKVVVKEFRFARENSSWSQYKVLEKEVEVLQKLNHSCIPKYLYHSETNDGAMIVMEYIEGERLNRRLFNTEEIYQIAISILKILVYLQSLNPPIVHRDIKPENIIIDKVGKVYLIDFGLAIVTEYALSMSISTLVGGTIGFAPPELLLGQKLSKGSDLYGLAATLFCLMAGIRTGELSSKVDSRFVLPIDSLEARNNHKFSNWLKKCGEPNLEERFDSAEIALDALKKIQIRSNTSIRDLNLRIRFEKKNQLVENEEDEKSLLKIKIFLAKLKKLIEFIKIFIILSSVFILSIYLSICIIANILKYIFT